MQSLSNIAIQHDKDRQVFDEAEAVIATALVELKDRLDQGRLLAGQVAPVQELLARLPGDPDFFLLYTPGGGAPPERLLTDHGKHSMDGSSLPMKSELGPALANRLKARINMTSNWPKLPESEKEGRSLP